MTSQQDNYAAALFVATQYATLAGLTTQQTCDPLIDQIAIRLAMAFKAHPNIDLDGLLEQVRHKLDLQLAAGLNNGSLGRVLLGPAPDKPRPPKEAA